MNIFQSGAAGNSGAKNIRVWASDGHDYSMPFDSMSIFLNHIPDSSTKHAIASIWVLGDQHFQLSDNPPQINILEDGRVELFWYNCDQTFPVSKVHDEMLYQIRSTPANSTCLITNAGFKTKHRLRTKPSDQPSAANSVFVNCFVVEFTPPHLLSKRALTVGNCTPEAVARVGNARQGVVRLNTFHVELDYPSPFDHKGLVLADDLVLCWNNDTTIIRAFKAFCESLTFPKRNVNLKIIQTSSTDKGTNKCTTLVSDPLSVDKIPMSNYVRFHAVATSLSLAPEIFFNSVDRTMRIDIKMPSPNSETHQTDQGSSATKKRKHDDVSIDADQLAKQIAKKVKEELTKNN